VHEANYRLLNAEKSKPVNKIVIIQVYCSWATTLYCAFMLFVHKSQEKKSVK